MSRTIKTMLAVVLVLVGTFSLVTALGYLTGSVRADLTQGDLYTLTDGTRKIIEKIDQPIEMKLYYSRHLALTGPQWIRGTYDYYTYVEDLLQEYRRASDGKIQLEILDPRPFSEAEQQALTAEINALPASMEPESGETEYFYFALTLRTQLGKVETLQLYDPANPIDPFGQDLLEYNITRAISRLVTPKARKIGILSSLPVMGMPGFSRFQPGMPEWPLVSALRQDFQVEPIRGDSEEIPDDVDLLMVVHPRNLPENLRFALDQWVLKGKATLIAVDPLCRAAQEIMPPNMQQPVTVDQLSSDLPQLLSAWGIALSQGVLVDETLSPSSRRSRASARQESILHFVMLEGPQMASESPITAGLEDIWLLAPGGLQLQPVENLRITPLLESTVMARTVPAMGMDISTFWQQLPQQYAMLQRGMMGPADPGAGSRIPIACLIEGSAKSAFPEGIEVPVEQEPETPEDPESDAGDEDPEEPSMRKLTGLTESAQPIRVVLTADVDFLRHAYIRSFDGQVRPIPAENGAFIFNAIDYLTASADLLSIRASKDFTRPFKVVEEMEEKAQIEVAEKVNKLQQERDRLLQQNRATIAQLQQEGTFPINELVKLQREQNELIQQKDREIRAVRNLKRQSIEQLGRRLQKYNMFIAPAVILFIALLLASYRIAKRRMFLRRAAQS